MNFTQEAMKKGKKEGKKEELINIVKIQLDSIGISFFVVLYFIKWKKKVNDLYLYYLKYLKFLKGNIILL